MTPIQGFVGGAYSLPSKSIACQRCVNLYVEGVPDDEKSSAVLLGTPGTLIDATTQAAFFNHITNAYNVPIRTNGIFVTSNGFLIVVVKNFLYAFKGFSGNSLVGYATTGASSFATLSFIHEPGYGPVAMADNGVILFVSSGNAVYKWTLSEFESGLITTGGRISSWAYGGFTHIDYLNGRFIVNTPNDPSNDPTKNFFRSSPLDWDGDVSTWDDLAVGSADQSPDPLLGLLVRGSDLVLFSGQSTEFYYDAAATPMPFVANLSVTSSIGCGAKYSIAKIEDTLFWLGAGADGANKIFKCSGMTPEAISNPAIEQEISSYGATDDAQGFAYQKDGHSFYIISFQTGNKTWQYDLSTGFWNELSSTNTVSGLQDRCRYVGLAQFLGRTLVLDRVANSVGILSGTTYDEDGQSIIRIRTSPHIYSSLNRVFFNRFQLDMETGVGLTVGQGSDPQCRLRWSNDGGHTWGNFLFRSFGAVGEYAKRVFWPRLGQSRNRVWEVSISDPVPVRILGAWVDAEEGEN